MPSEDWGWGPRASADRTGWKSRLSGGLPAGTEALLGKSDPCERMAEEKLSYVLDPECELYLGRIWEKERAPHLEGRGRPGKRKLAAVPVPEGGGDEFGAARRDRRGCRAPGSAGPLAP